MGTFLKVTKRVINVVDSTTIKLVANCMDWAKHRRRKAAAKCHMRLDLQTFLPRFALVKAANTHDSTEAPELCADIRAGEVVVFDKAYVDVSHLYSLAQREVFWVTRAKDNMAYEIVGQQTAPSGPVLLDAQIRLTVEKSRGDYPELMRLIVAVVSEAQPSLPTGIRPVTHGTARVPGHGKCANTGPTKNGKGKLTKGSERPS